LDWNITSFDENLNVDLNEETDSCYIYPDTNWIGTASILFSVMDDESAADTAFVMFNVISSFIVAEDTTLFMMEDQEYFFNLDQLVLKPTETEIREAVNWTVEGPDENIDIDTLRLSEDRVIGLKPKPNWNGREFIDLSATLLDTELNAILQVVVEAVNDTPRVSLDDIILSENNRYKISLSLNSLISQNHIYDVDDGDSLTWDVKYTNQEVMNLINISYSENRDTIRISAIEPPQSLSDSLIFTVYDTSGANSKDTVGISVISTYVSIRLKSDSLSMNEDEIKNYSIKDLDIVTSNISYFDLEIIEKSTFIDANLISENSNWMITIQPIENWYGNDSISLGARYNGQLYDTAPLYIVVNAINDPPEFTEEFKEKITHFESNVPRDIGFSDIFFDTLCTASPIDTLIVRDYDNSFSDLKWEFDSDKDHIVLNEDIFYSSNRIHFTINDLGWQGTDKVILFVRDPEGLSDSLEINLTLGPPSSNNQVMAFQTVQALQFGSATNIAVSWSSAFSSESYVRFGLDDSFEFVTLRDTLLNKSHFHILENLTPNTTYLYQTVVIDSVDTYYYSEYYTFTTGDLGDINVFPNPYRAGEYQQNDFINFTGLPVNSSIQIFNLLGEPVFRKNEVTNIYRWKAVNDHNKSVQSGLYLYVVKDQDNKKLASGKLVIIR
jgi:hypothetical protein